MIPAITVRLTLHSSTIPREDVRKVFLCLSRTPLQSWKIEKNRLRKVSINNARGEEQQQCESDLAQ